MDAPADFRITHEHPTIEDALRVAFNAARPVVYVVPDIESGDRQGYDAWIETLPAERGMRVVSPRTAFEAGQRSMQPAAVDAAGGMKPPIAWMRIMVRYMRPENSQRTSRVNWIFECDDPTVIERNSWRVWGDGDGQDTGTQLGATVLGELLPVLSWWAGQAEREQLAFVASQLGEDEPPPASRVRLVPMVLAALLENTTVDLLELNLPAVRTAAEILEALRSEALTIAEARHHRQLSEVHELLLHARKIAKDLKHDDLERTLGHADSLITNGNT